MFTSSMSQFLMSLAFSLTTNTEVQLCKGFLPENDMRIPVSVHQVGGITKEEFDAVLNKVEAFYAPIISQRGGNLELTRDWADDTVNAYASRMGRTWTIKMYGGLARHPAMTKDGFMMVACHETGHHIGGAPKVAGWFGNDWASNEGQSDYFATLRCLRNFFSEEETAQFVQDNAIDPTLKQACEQQFQTMHEKNTCMRAGVAGRAGAELFRQMRKIATEPRFDTPDPAQVHRTDDDHPAAQCRLDTYFQGALCVNTPATELSDTDPNPGTCTLQNGQSAGLRPRCWFAP
jgi:hypothetical protein